MQDWPRVLHIHECAPSLARNVSAGTRHTGSANVANTSVSDAEQSVQRAVCPARRSLSVAVRTRSAVYAAIAPNVVACAPDDVMLQMIHASGDGHSHRADTRATGSAPALHNN